MFDRYPGGASAFGGAVFESIMWALLPSMLVRFVFNIAMRRKHAGKPASMHTQQLNYRRILVGFAVILVALQAYNAVSGVATVDYYARLNVTANATDAQIKSSFRKMSVHLHPDKNPDDPNANDVFMELRDAYEVLSDKKKRVVYDNLGPGVLECQHCITYKEFAEHAMVYVALFYVATVVLLWAVTSRRAIAWLRLWLFGLLFVPACVDLLLLTQEDNALNKDRSNLLPFQLALIMRKGFHVLMFSLALVSDSWGSDTRTTHEVVMNLELQVTDLMRMVALLMERQTVILNDEQLRARFLDKMKERALEREMIMTDPSASAVFKEGMQKLKERKERGEATAFNDEDPLNPNFSSREARSVSAAVSRKAKGAVM